MKELLIRAQRCLGCRSCELACAVEHSRSKSLLAAIRETGPRAQYRVHVTSENGQCLPLQCRNCEDAPCLNACLSGALQRDERGVVIADSDRCVGCWMCVMVCPFAALDQKDGERRIIKCDRCPEREVPACVSACPVGALVYSEVKTTNQTRRREIFDHFKQQGEL